jgi:hypothetical protein
MSEAKRVPAKRKEKSACPVCGKPTTGGEYCSSDCEVKMLRQQVVEQQERLDRAKRKKDPVRCYGRVIWATCVQEWYSKSSFDAKRRALELRALGFDCAAQSIGKMPLNINGTRADVTMTVVTCPLIEKGKIPPKPEMVNGLDIDPKNR